MRKYIRLLLAQNRNQNDQQHSKTLRTWFSHVPWSHNKQRNLCPNEKLGDSTPSPHNLGQSACMAIANMANGIPSLSPNELPWNQNNSFWLVAEKREHHWTSKHCKQMNMLLGVSWFYNKMQHLQGNTTGEDRCTVDNPWVTLHIVVHDAFLDVMSHYWGSLKIPLTEVAGQLIWQRWISQPFCRNWSGLSSL